MFGQLNPTLSVQQIQVALSNLINSFNEVEDIYLWMSAYSITDLESLPFSLPVDDAQAILNALADAHSLHQTALGTAGFPTATLPYNFFASMRAVTGPR